MGFEINDKKVAENVSELTLIAYELKEKADGEFDSRVIFEEIYDLAVEFEKIWEILDKDEYEPDYLTEIEKFGLDRLSKFFGIERKFYGKVAPILRFNVDATSKDEAGAIVVQRLRVAGFDVSDGVDFMFEGD